MELFLEYKVRDTSSAVIFFTEKEAKVPFVELLEALEIVGILWD